jgi:uncharacterized cupredoxin-like copper-binding protein
MSRPIFVAALPAAAVTALAIAGCGGSSGSASTTTAKPTLVAMRMPAARRGEILRLSAAPNGQLRFTTSRLTAPRPGRVTLIMNNPKSTGMKHGIAVEGHGVDKDGPIVAAGKSSTLTVTLKKGTYAYYCPVPGHRQAGMRGTLTVK